MHPEEHGALAELARVGGLELLVLHGSRASGAAHASSDWDFGFLAREVTDVGAIDVGAMTSELGRVLRTDRIDLVDLARASALLRYRAASGGRCVYEHTAGTFEQFVLGATLYWCDAEPVFRRAHELVLARLDE